MISQHEKNILVPGCEIQLYSGTTGRIDEISTSRNLCRLESGKHAAIKKIRKVISWPIPEKFTKSHIGDFIKVKSQTSINYAFDTQIPYWYEITNVTNGQPIIQVAEKDDPTAFFYSAIELCDIEHYLVASLSKPYPLFNTGRTDSSKNISQSHHIGTIRQITSNTRSAVLKDLKIGTWITFPFSGGWKKVTSMNTTAVFTDMGKAGVLWEDITSICEVDPTLRGISLDGKVYGQITSPTPIRDKQWDKLKEGHWVKIAPEGYIKKLLDPDGQYFGIDYSKSQRKTSTFGTWQRVIKKHQSKPSVGICDTFSIHRDFIVDTSEKKPKLTLKELAYQISLGGYDYEDAFSEYKKSQPISTDHIENMIQVGSWIKLSNTDWRKVEIVQGEKIFTSNHVYFLPNQIKACQVAIPDEQWNKLKPGMWVKIASHDYIKSVCRIDSHGKWMHKNNNYEIPAKMRMFGKWHKTTIVDREIQCGGFYWHRDFIVDISETEPAEDYKALSTMVDEKSVLTGDQLAVYKKMYATGEPGAVWGGDPSLIDGGNCVLSTISNKEYWMFFNMNENQKEKIMLETLEEIKNANIHADILEKAAQETKRINDDELMNQVRERQEKILKHLAQLEAFKKRNDEEISKAQEMLAALGYPPKNAK